MGVSTTPLLDGGDVEDDGTAEGAMVVFWINDETVGAAVVLDALSNATVGVGGVTNDDGIANDGGEVVFNKMLLAVVGGAVDRGAEDGTSVEDDVDDDRVVGGIVVDVVVDGGGDGRY